MVLFQMVLSHIPLIFREKAVFMAFLKCVFEPMQTLSDWYLSYRYAVMSRLKYNGQVIYLERALNDAIDTTLRRIHIDDAAISSIDPAILYRANENQATEILYRNNEAQATICLYRASEIPRDDFVVFVPSQLQIRQSEIRGIVEYYKIASKIYKIQYV